MVRTHQCTISILMAIYGQDAQTRSSSTLDGFNVQLPHMRPASLLHRHVLMLILHLLLLSGRLATPWLPWTRSRCQKKTVIATFIDSYSAIIDFDSCGWHCFFFLLRGVFGVQRSYFYIYYSPLDAVWFSSQFCSLFVGGFSMEPVRCSASLQ